MSFIHCKTCQCLPKPAEQECCEKCEKRDASNLGPNYRYCFPSDCPCHPKLQEQGERVVEHTPSGGYGKECECTDNGNDGRTRGKNCDILHIPNPQHVPSSKCEHHGDTIVSVGKANVCGSCGELISSKPKEVPPVKELKYYPVIDARGKKVQNAPDQDEMMDKINEVVKRLNALTHGTGENKG